MLSDQTRPDVFIVNLLKPVIEYVSKSRRLAVYVGREYNANVLITDLQVSGMAQNIFHSSHGVIHEL